jgi:hypothetical protein
MPPRSVTVVIVVFWLAMTAWLVRRDIWPRLAPGEPPPFTVHYADEQQTTHIPVRWTATRIPAGTPEPIKYHASTNVEYNREARPRAYVLGASMIPGERAENSLQLYTFRNLKSSYRASEEGRLLGFEVSAVIAPGTLNPTGDLRVQFTGELKGGTCELAWSRQGSGAASGKTHFEVSLIGNVILPLHPLARMTGLSPGRSWGAWVFDPLGSLLTGPQLTWVHVSVRREVATLVWKGKAKRCRLVEYEGDNVNGSIWVETTRDEVLQMEVGLHGDRWKIVRD